MKIRTHLGKSLVLAALTWSAIGHSRADVTYTIDPGATWVGYMNVFAVGGPGNGMAGAGAYQFGGTWGTPDLRANFSGNTLSLQANTIGDPDPYWYTPAGGPGAVGNKIMDANFYQEFTGALDGTTVTFTGNVLNNGLLGAVDAAGHGWTIEAFVKDFAPDYSSSVSSAVSLPASGIFSVSLATIADPARHVQFGFQVIGPDVWAGDPLSLVSVDVVAVPEPASLAMILIGATAFARRRN